MKSIGYRIISCYSACLLTFSLLIIAPGKSAAPAPSLQTCVTPPSGMVAWYPGDGNTDDIQNGNKGTLEGGATFAPGMVGQAFSLNGTDAFVQAPSSAATDPTTAGSQDAWVMFNQLPSAAGHIMEIIGKGGFGTDFDLQAETDNRFHFYIAANTSVASNTVIQTGVWYHVAGAWDSIIGLQMYVNGALENTNPTLLTRSQSGQPLEIGNQPFFAGRFFDGLIDEVEVFGRALSASEVLGIFNAGSAGKCKPPLPTTLILSSQLSPFAEVPPTADKDAAGVGQGSVVLHLVLDSDGNITAASADVVVVALALNGSSKIIGATVNQGGAGATGPVVIDSGLSAANPFALSSGSGQDFLFSRPISAAQATQLVSDPSTFYFSIETDGTSTGAVRGQMFPITLDGTKPPPLEFATTISPASDNPPITGGDAAATGIAIVYIILTVDNTGAITGANAEIDLLIAGLPPAENLVGASVKQGSLSKKTTKSPTVIDSGLTASSPTPVTPAGSATIRVTNLAVTTAAVGGMLANPAGFFFNLDTTANPSGALRGQLAQLPAITGASISGTSLVVDGVGFEKGSVILVNGTNVKTKNNGAKATTELIAKKEAANITVGTPVLLIVQNPDGLVSPAFTFLRAQ
jgi:hypothetical protein